MLFKFYLLLASYTTKLISSVFVLRSAAVPNGETGRVMASPGSTCLIGIVMDGFLLLMSVFGRTTLNESVCQFEPFSEKSHPPTHISSYSPDHHSFHKVSCKIHS